MKTRIDRLTAITIEAVLNNGPSRNIQELALVFAERKIALDVALRVLTRPWERREGAHSPLSSTLSRYR
jgi:hypothetical protein